MPGHKGCQHGVVEGPDGGVLAALRRWEASGGTWRVVRRRGERVELELLSCDAGEVMQRLQADGDPAVEAHLRGRDRSED